MASGSRAARAGQRIRRASSSPAGSSFQSFPDYRNSPPNALYLCQREETQMTALQPTIDHAASANVSGDLEQTTSAASTSEPAVSPKIWLAVAGATLGAFMAVLNIPILNALLAAIQGAIGGRIDEGGRGS